MGQALRVLFAGGGTGGHLYPGLAVAGQLRAMCPEAEIRFLATRRAIDRLVLEREGYAAQYEDARGLSSRPWLWPAFGLRLMRNMRRAREYLAAFGPQAVVGLGGFGSFAPVRQAQKMAVPTFVLNPDLVVGRANRRLAAGADVVFCQFAETTQGLRIRGRVEVVGCPVRDDLFGIDRRRACGLLGLDPDRKVLVVAGGSSGARSVNQAFALLADRWRQFADWQVLHLAGRGECASLSAAVGGDRPGYRVRDYVDEMGLVYAAADLFVSRAGAVTVAELTALGVPSVLMPYPYHRDKHQERHAALLERAEAAVMVRDHIDPERNVEALWQVVPGLMEDDERRARMAEAAKALGRPKAAKSVAAAILGAAGRLAAHEVR